MPQKCRLRKAKGKAKAGADGIIDVDEDDNNYEDTDAESDSDKTDTLDDEDDGAIPNKEVFSFCNAYRLSIDVFLKLTSMLPSKTIPLGGKPAGHQLQKSSKTKPLKKRQHVTEEEGPTSHDTMPHVVPDSQVHYQPI